MEDKILNYFSFDKHVDLSNDRDRIVSLIIEDLVTKIQFIERLYPNIGTNYVVSDIFENFSISDDRLGGSRMEYNYIDSLALPTLLKKKYPSFDPEKFFQCIPAISINHHVYDTNSIVSYSLII